MPPEVIQFLSILFNALASGVVLSHVLERPGKMALAPATYIEVQQKLFTTYGMAVGALETFALLTTLAWWLLDHGWLVGLAALADAAMIGIWAIGINPINQRVNRWRIGALPVDWARLRDRWEALHTIRAILSLVALCALLLAVKHASVAVS
jgi:anthrone oxygenase-like protein